MIQLKDDITSYTFLAEALARLEITHPYLQDIYGIRGAALGRGFEIVNKAINIAKNTEYMDIYRNSKNQIVFSFINFGECLNGLSVNGLRAQRFERPPQRSFSSGQLVVSEVKFIEGVIKRNWRVYDFREYGKIKEKLSRYSTLTYWVRVRSKVGRPAKKTGGEEC